MVMILKTVSKIVFLCLLLTAGSQAAFAACDPVVCGGTLPPTTGCRNCNPFPPTPPLGQSQYTFLGVCTDCTGTGTGILRLQDYTPGASLTPANFVFFDYFSNLTSLFIGQDTVTALSG
jgi:hypothetical protein